MAFLQTSSDFLARTYQFLREPSTSPQYWPSAHVADLVDEAQCHLVRDFWLNRAEWFTNTSAAAGAGNALDGVYTLPADVMVIRYVLWTDPTQQGIYAALTQKTVTDFIVGNLLASGTPTNWALVGFASAAGTSWTQVGGGTAAGLGQQAAIRIWPSPTQSAASGLYVIGSQMPFPLATSATTVPLQLREMIPIMAAGMAWQERGSMEQLAALKTLYDNRLSAWRQIMADMGQDEQDATEFRTFESQFPHAGTLRPVMLTPNPLWP